MKIAIIGSRNFKNLPRIYEAMYDYFGCEFISGGAKGVDSECKRVCERYNQELIEHKPNYDLHGDNAPHVRNDKIIADADKVIAFWNGERKSGTYSVISKCLQRRKNIEVIFY